MTESSIELAEASLAEAIAAAGEAGRALETARSTALSAELAMLKEAEDARQAMAAVGITLPPIARGYRA